MGHKTIKRLPDHLETLLRQTKGDRLHGSLTLGSGRFISDGGKYVQAWALEYLISGSQDCVDRLEAVYQTLNAETLPFEALESATGTGEGVRK